MTEGEAYLAQAKSDLRVFDLLVRHQAVEVCHALHYLQMGCEKLAKAVFHVQLGSVPISHVALSKITYMLQGRKYADKLGYKGKHDSYDMLLEDSTALFRAIEKLCPAVADSQKHARDMPNVEYPWQLPGGMGWQAPCVFKFTLGNDILYEANARQTLNLLKLLADRFHEVFK